MADARSLPVLAIERRARSLKTRPYDGIYGASPVSSPAQLAEARQRAAARRIDRTADRLTINAATATATALSQRTPNASAADHITSITFAIRAMLGPHAN